MEPHSFSRNALYDQDRKQFQGELLSMIVDKIRYEEVISLLEKADDLNSLDSFGNTLLHIAAQHNNMVITQSLIQSRCEIDVQNSSGKTPLIVAIENKSQNSTDILLFANANIFICDNEGYSALDWVFYVHCFHTSQFLEKFLRVVERQCYNDNVEIANKLYNAGCILPWTVSMKNVKVIEKMLMLGCDLNVREPGTGHTALHKAILLRDVECVRFLLAYDVHPHALGKFDFSFHLFQSFSSNAHAPSTSAYGPRRMFDLLEYGNKEAIQTLVQANFDLTTRNLDLNTAAHFLAKNHNPGVFQVLEDRNFDFNARNTSSETPLLIAASCGNAGAVEFLLKRGAEVNVVNADHRSPLYTCVEKIFRGTGRQYEACVQLLLEYDADVLLDAVPVANRPSIFHLMRISPDYFINELLIAQLVLKEALGTPITEFVLNLIYSHHSFEDYYNLSKRQLATKFDESLTLLDLLRDNDDKFERHVRDQQVASNVLHYNELKMNSRYFNPILQKRYTKAIHVSDLRKEAAIFICKLMKTDYCRISLIIDQIVNYLRESDLKNLLQVSL